VRIKQKLDRHNYSQIEGDWDSNLDSDVIRLSSVRHKCVNMTTFLAEILQISRIIKVLQKMINTQEIISQVSKSSCHKMVVYHTIYGITSNVFFILASSSFIHFSSSCTRAKNTLLSLRQQIGRCKRQTTGK
jgi:hypothetical protein